MERNKKLQANIRGNNKAKAKRESKKKTEKYCTL